MDNYNQEMPQKIPVEYLLKRSRQECGELKSYIQELQHYISKLESVIHEYKRTNKDLSKEIRKEELYKNIIEQNKKLRKQIKDNKEVRDRLIYEVTQLRLKYESTSV